MTELTEDRVREIVKEEIAKALQNLVQEVRLKTGERL